MSAIRESGELALHIQPIGSSVEYALRGLAGMLERFIGILFLVPEREYRLAFASQPD